MNEFQVLRCDCGSERFLPVVRLKYKREGGTITEPAGHKCEACGAIVDNAYMVRLIDIQAKRAEAKRLLDEVGVAEAATKKPEPKKPVEAAAAGRS